MIKKLKPVTLLIFLCLAIAVIAQNNTKSPYSARGLGELEPFNTAYARSLGGVSNGIRSTRFISLSNPASASALKQVVFDFGLTASSGTLTSENSNGNYYNGNFNYVILGFPIWQKEVLAKDTSKKKNKATSKANLVKTYKTIWSTAFGLMPYSNVGSSYYKTNDTTYGKLASYYSNSGGLTDFFMMNAVNLSKNISIGLNTGYVFGQIYDRSTFLLNDSGVSRLFDSDELYYLKGFKFDFGVQTQHHDTFTKRKIDRIRTKDGSSYKNDTTYKRIPLKFVFGSTINSQSKLNYDYTRIALGKSNYYLVNPTDTVILRYSSGKTYFPFGYSLGFSVKYNNLWLLAFDYSSNLFAKQKEPLFNDIFTNSSQFSIGLGYKPDLNTENMNTNRGADIISNVKNYLSNVEIRTGYRYLNTGYNFKDNQGIVAPIKEYGFNFGVGFPIIKKIAYIRDPVKSMINVGMEYIHRGTTKNGMVDESIYKFTLGITLGDIWFTKRKFN